MYIPRFRWFRISHSGFFSILMLMACLHCFGNVCERKDVISSSSLRACAVCFVYVSDWFRLAHASIKSLVFLQVSCIYQLRVRTSRPSNPRETE